MAFIFAILAVILSCIIIWRASDGFEAASEYLGRNLSEGVRGATINAIGSSMPELFTTLLFLFALSESDKFAGGIGTTAGSAIFNGMIIPAVVIFAVIGIGIVSKVIVSKKVILRDGLALIICELGLIFLISGSRLEWWHGLALMLMYAAYVTVMFTTMSKGEGGEDEEEEENNDDDGNNASIIRSLFTLDLESAFARKGINTGNALLLLLMAMLVMGLACYVLVESCIYIGAGLGIRTYFVAVIIASAATSIPDTILSYRDAMAGNYDDAVANALGSNIFDICFALGFPLFLYTITYGPLEMNAATLNDVTELRVLLLTLTILAFLIYYLGKGLGKAKAFLLIGIYIVFTLYILGKAYDVELCNQIGVFLRSMVGK